jgi:exodeoxyribonuclease VII large subunit
MVLTRGGGAQTDFLIFDDYKIGLAIAKFPIPVITGIGHQKNETIADLMAHTALKTPTKAAEFIIAHNKAFEDRVLALQKAVVIRSQQLFSKHFRSLAAIQSTVVNQSRDILSEQKDRMASSRQLVLQRTRKILFDHKSDLMQVSSVIASKPRVMLANRGGELKNITGNLRSFHTQFLKNQRGYLNHLQTVIRLMHPSNILKKGFALVKVDGRITSKPGDLQIGTSMDVILSSTQISSTVTSKKTYDGNEFDL